MFPPIDRLAGLDLSNPEDDSLSENPWFRLVAWLWVVERRLARLRADPRKDYWRSRRRLLSNGTAALAAL